MDRFYLSLIVTILALPIWGCSQVNPALRNASPSRATLLVTNDDVRRIQDAAKTDVELQHVAATLQKSADRLLNDPVVERKLIGPRLLAVSREAQRRIWLLAGMYRWTNDRKYLDRAVVELRAVCKFVDWNPSHFLDVAEMSAAVSVGYDWLYDDLSIEDRELIRKAIVAKALLPAIDAYKNKVWWTTTDINWAQVCSGGLVMGAIAVRQEEPHIASKILDLTQVSIQRPMHVYAPDGGYKEGAGYWNYGTKYNVLYFAALQSALGMNSPFVKMEGFEKTGFFRIHTIGPSGKLFNYADCNEPPGNASHMFWLAKQFHQPMFAQFEREYAKEKPDILHLFWWNSDKADLTKLPTAVKFDKAGVICMRSGWDKNAMYIGIKAGSSDFSHAHLDLGTFVLDWAGERWVSDLGSDDYNLPGYFGEKRWEYFRLRTEGHNTITLDGKNQLPKAVATIDEFNPRGFCIIDLSAPYERPSQTLTRTVAITRPGMMRMLDGIGIKSARTWTFYTTATVKQIDETHLELEQNGKCMAVENNSTGAFKVEPLIISPPQKPARGITRVTITDPVGSYLQVNFGNPKDEQDYLFMTDD